MIRYDSRQQDRGFVALLLFLVMLAGALSCRGSKPGTLAPASIPTPAPDECASLATLWLPDATITSVTVVPVAAAAPDATDPVPEYCKVLGTLEQTILFEVALPTTAWNGKFMFAGGGRFNGSIPSLTHLLARGYAAAGSDTGHQAPSYDGSWALNNLEAQLNYGHRATHLVTVLAKTIVREYYGQQAKRDYFLGCSNGGKMGLMEVQRYPEDFDGVIVGNFVLDRTRLMTAFVWNARAVAENPIPEDKVPVIAKATLAACDSQDGLVDGLIDRPDRCKFDPKILTCKSGDAPDCLTPGQVATLEKLYGGPRNSAGEQLFPGYPPGHEDDYPMYQTGSLSNHPTTIRIRTGNDFMKYFVFGPKFDSIRDFDFDKSPSAPEVLRAAADQDAADPDLRAFKAHGGKLIMYHGWADHSITPLRDIQYYKDVLKQVEYADEFVRLFVAPGLYHCTGGPGPNHFGGTGQRWPKDDAEHDIVRALDRWVEEGVVPEMLIATKFVNDDPKMRIARTRPLCPYPLMARYKGSGSIDDAANFVCADPQ